MKKARKLITFILTVVMVLSMSMNVWAAGEGSITITNAKDGTTYAVYQILELESYSGTSYSYKVTNEKWKAFLETKKGTLVSIENDYVTWIGDEATEETDAAAFAKEALAYAEANDIEPTDVKTAETDGNLSFTGLDLGYYLVDSTRGVLCSLNTTDDTAEITEKNEVPEIQKTVTGDNDLDATTNTAKIGDDVSFKVVITAKEGAKGYVLHDKMVEGLTLKPETIDVDTDESNYTIETVDVCDKGCSFEIIFDDDYLATLADNEKITVTYEATLNTEAKVGAEGNDNTANLEYGEAPWVDTDGDGEPDIPANPDDPNAPDKPTTTPVTTTTFTYKFSLVKTDGDSNKLNGAQFKLYDAESGGNEIPLEKVSEGVYRVAPGGTAVIEAGTAVINGLENGKYYLEEIKEPQGYNKLTGRVEVEIKDGDKVEGSEEVEGVKYGVQVENNTGSELPSTGGIGTTIFYIVGGALVLFAVVLLVTKKRMKDTQ